MKILWLCNLMLPQVAVDLGKEVFHTGGWLTGLLDDLQKQTDFQMAVCFPMSGEKTVVSGQVDKLAYYGFPSSLDARADLEAMQELFTSILGEFRPDVVHIFGTEYAHTLAMLQAGENTATIDRMVVSIQGMVSVYARHYYAGLPFREVYMSSLRDLIKKDNVYWGAREFERKGQYEIAAIQKCKNVIGRTDWDRACTSQINPSVNYFHCNETLRSSFYENKWDLNQCSRHTIFVSQWYNPIKGFHHVLEAAAILADKYPDLRVYTTGQSPVKQNFMQSLRQSHYAKYIGRLIRKYGLEENVSFLGPLDEKKMCGQFLKSNVFVSASSIENSPNSVGEAMLLGVPTVSTDVGGVKNMLNHGTEGFLYPFDEPYMLAYYIEKIFEDDGLALSLSQNAHKHASITHSREINRERTCEIYSRIHEAEKRGSTSEASCDYPAR